MNISSSPQVISLANSLGLLEGDPVESIQKYCLDKVKAFLVGIHRPLSMDLLEEVICKKLKLGIHRVWSEEDMDQLISKYVGSGEIIFAALRQQLSPDAFGIFIRLTKPNELGEPWVAVIDCRGNKQFRRHWTFWHEVTHCLTAVEEMQLPLRRTTIQNAADKEPIEVLTDYVAKHLAFYGPVFDPILKLELERDQGRISFALVDRVRSAFCPETSFLSTLYTCVDRFPNPCLILRAAPGFSKRELDQIASGKIRIEPALRVMETRPNDAMRRRELFIPHNYRIPPNSAIMLASRQPSISALIETRRTENLTDWTDSSGRSLPPAVIHVEARCFNDQVTAIIEAI